MLHAKALAVVVAYDIYLECCEGAMDNSWQVKKPVDFYTFREKLAKQMIQCNPTDRKYPGDEKFRVSTQQPKKRRFANVTRQLNPSDASVEAESSGSSTTSKLTRGHFTKNTKRLCGDLTFLYRHVKSVKPTDSSGCICVVCGKRCYQVCTACGEAMHRFSTKERTQREVVPCFYHHHNTSFFGLSKKDAPVNGTKTKEWCFPSPNKMARHRRDVQRILQPRAIPTHPTATRVAPTTTRVAATSVATTAVETAATQPTQQPDDGVPIDYRRVI